MGQIYLGLDGHAGISSDATLQGQVQSFNRVTRKYKSKNKRLWASYQDASGTAPSQVHVCDQSGEGLRAGPGLAGGNVYLSCRVQ